jgi:hypothetical protein
MKENAMPSITLTLDRAIAVLSEEALRLDAIKYRRGATIRELERLAAIDLAIDALSQQARVAHARRTDPSTSHRAVPEAIKAGSAREKILLAAVEAQPMTARELALEANLGYQRSPWKRVSELAKAGFLSPVGEVTDPESGHRATTYAITAKGLAASAGLRDRMGAS